MARKVLPWKRITVAALVVADETAVADGNKEVRKFTFVLNDKTSGQLEVNEKVVTDKIVGTRVRITLEKVDGAIVVRNIDTEKPAEFTEVDIDPFGIFPSKK